jgi:hypothetical protein
MPLNFYLLLIVVSVMMTIAGGISDITGYRYIASKEHYWRDATYILLLVITLKLVFNA